MFYLKLVLARFLRVVKNPYHWGVLGNVSAVVSLMIVAIFSCLQYEEMQENREMRAMQVLSSSNTIGSAKVKALEYLARRGVVLDGIDLSSKEESSFYCLEGLDLSYKNIGKRVSMRNAKFQKIKLKNVNLSDVDLTGANFFDLDLDGTNFEGANLSKSRFEGRYICHANFQLANLQGAVFSVSIIDANFRGADLTAASFEDGCIGKSNFQLAILRASTFKNINFIQGDEWVRKSFYGSYIAYADFRKVAGMKKDYISDAWIYESDKKNFFVPCVSEKLGNPLEFIKIRPCKSSIIIQ